MASRGGRKTKLWYISNTRLFSGLEDSDLKELVTSVREVEVNRKSFVYTSGDPSDKVYILKEGRIRIYRLTDEGKEITLDILSPGDIFGELSLGGEQERETMAEALEDSFICVMERKDFERFLAKRPGLSLAVTRWMGLRLRTIESRFEDLIFRDVRTRILRVLEDLSNRYGVPVEEGTKINLRMTHSDIAALVGAARETVTLELNALRKKGRIIVQGKHIIIPSRDHR